MDNGTQAAVALSEFKRFSGNKLLAFTSVLNVILRNRQKVLIFGNGGSAAEASHFAAELIGRFDGINKPYAAIALQDPCVITALANDYGFEHVFSKQIEALADYGDMAVAFSTSGTSPNILFGLQAARLLGLPTALFTGEAQDDPLVADFVLRIPSFDTATIQECHLSLIHEVCRTIKGSEV